MIKAEQRPTAATGLYAFWAPALFLFLVLLSLLDPPRALSATLDDFYGPLLPAKKMLYSGEASVYAMRERGLHGSPSFSGFVSEPEMFAVKNGVTLPLFPGSEVSVDITNDLPSRYDRATKNNADVVSSYQRYHLISGQELTAGGRYRRGLDEFFLGASLKRGSSDWNYGATKESTPSIFNYFDSSYEDVNIVWRHLSASDGDRAAGGLARVDRPLLDPGQLNLEGGVSVDNGRMTRKRQYYHPTDSQSQHYIFRTAAHASPRVLVRYGLTPDIEAGVGAGFKTPFKYKYYYELYNQSGTSQLIRGAYAYDEWIECPLMLRVRPAERWEFQGAADFRYVNQKLDHWKKFTSGTVTAYPRKKLDFYQVKPSLGLTYLGGPEAGPPQPDDLLLGHALIGKGQFLAQAEWRKDVSISRGNGANSSQNFADPYDVYRYPLEFFVAGTEYAAFLSGNNGTLPAQVDPQNFHEFRLGVNYGFADALNMGVLVGYRTGSHTHQFALSDMADRQYRFRPFCYLDWRADWRVRRNVLILLTAHVVPDYKTTMTSSLASTPEEYKEHTRYVVASACVRVLF